MSVQDYRLGMDIKEDDAGTTDMVPKDLMNRLGEMFTLVEELLDEGEASMESEPFFEKRGEVLDMLQEPEVAAWIDYMRKLNRTRFRRFSVID